MRLAFILALVATAFACKSTGPAPSSAFLTTATRKAIRDMCRDLSPDGDRVVRHERACACLRDQHAQGSLAPLVERYCAAEGASYYDALLRTAKAEAILVLTDSTGKAPSQSDIACAQGLAEMHIEWSIDAVGQACRENRVTELASRLDLPAPAAPGSCWRLVRMDENDCLVATPCTGRGPASVAALPIDAASRAKANAAASIGEGKDVRLCHPGIRAMHRLKDPRHANLDYNYPFANYLAMNRSNANVTYGAANCHGTAQALSGNFLATFPVTAAGFHSAEIERQCGTKARAAFASVRNPTGATLPVGRGGYVVNMIHDKSCSPLDCGKVSFQTFSCTDTELESYVFFEGMCINCWHELLEKAGKRRLPAAATWRDLKRGCVMTVSDHSVTLVYANDGYCYFYESLSPFASPQLNVSECPALFARFPGRWCPQSDDLGFELTNW